MHPQIAAFARLARENAVPTRKLEGQLTRLGRTMHDMDYDPIHDEIVVGSPFAQAVLVFRGRGGRRGVAHSGYPGAAYPNGNSG